MSGNNGEKSKTTDRPKFDEQHLFCFLHVALRIIEKLSGQGARICIKQEALDRFPDIEKPILVWDKRKKHWAALNPMNPEPKKQKKPKLALPRKGLILPPGG